MNPPCDSANFSCLIRWLFSPSRRLLNNIWLVSAATTTTQHEPWYRFIQSSVLWCFLIVVDKWLAKLCQTGLPANHWQLTRRFLLIPPCDRLGKLPDRHVRCAQIPRWLSFLSPQSNSFHIARARWRHRWAIRTSAAWYCNFYRAHFWVSTLSHSSA